MLYLFTATIIICVTAYICHNIPTWLMKREYTILSTRILQGQDVDISRFCMRWYDHPEYYQYYHLLQNAIDKADAERGLGV